MFHFLITIFCFFHIASSLTVPYQDTPVPVLQSLVDPKSLSQLIQTHYSLPKETQVVLLNSGDNDVYLVTVGEEKYIFRVYRHNKHWLKKKDNYLFEMEWLNFLKENNLPISYPIPQKNGEYLGEFNAPEGRRYWALFNFAQGTSVMNPKRAEIFGKSIALIHLASDDFQAHYQRHHINEKFLIEDPIHRLEQFLKNSRPQDLDFLKVLGPKLQAGIAEIPLDVSEYGVIHGDFHGWNQHFSDSNEVMHFDFDLCGYGWRAYDLAVFRWSRGADDELWDAFLKGYTSIRPLGTKELEAIPLFTVVRQLWVMGSHVTYPFARHDQNYWDNAFQELRCLADNTVIHASLS